MASKYWFVNRHSTQQKQPRSERQELLGSISSGSSGSSLVTIKSSRESKKLNILDPFQEFIIRQNNAEKLCSSNTYYNVSNFENGLLLTGVQERYCCCFKDPFEKVAFYDNENQTILQLEKTDFSGFLSTKLRFTVSSPKSHIIGEIVRITEFLEKPKYEVNDAHGDILFSLAIVPPCPSSRNSKNVTDYSVTSKYGKVAHIQEEKGTSAMKIIQACSIVEKALLISLAIFMDLIKRGS